MESKLNTLQAFNAMTLYLDKYYNITASDDIGALLGGFQLFEEGGTWDPAAWHDWMDSVNSVINNKFKKDKVEENLTILQALNVMISFLEKYYELTSYNDLGIILNSLNLFEKNNDFNSLVWRDWVECVNKVLYENYQNIGSFKK